MRSGNFEIFASLRHRNFRLFFGGQTISLLGSWMQSVALSWLVLILTNSSFYLGLVSALQALPILIFSFLGGVVADRAHKQRLLYLTQEGMMVVALLLGLLVISSYMNIWLLCFLTFLAGTALAFDIPVRQAFIVEMVGKPDLPNAIALNSTMFNGTRVLGPALAGLLIAQVGMANCFFLNALSFLAVLLALFRMELPPPVKMPRVPMRAALAELRDFVKQNQNLKLILILMTLVSIFGSSYFVLVPILARNVLGAGPRGFGILMATSGLGAFLGGLALARRLDHASSHALLPLGTGHLPGGAFGPVFVPQFSSGPGRHVPDRGRHGDPTLHGEQPAPAQCPGSVAGPHDESVQSHYCRLGALWQYAVRHRGHLPGPQPDLDPGKPDRRSALRIHPVALPEPAAAGFSEAGGARQRTRAAAPGAADGVRWLRGLVEGRAGGKR